MNKGAGTGQGVRTVLFTGRGCLGVELKQLSVSQAVLNVPPNQDPAFISTSLLISFHPSTSSSIFTESSQLISDNKQPLSPIRGQ